MKVNLEGKVALVTGAARGIGRAIADALGDNGAQVIYSDVQLPQGVSGKAMLLDVTDEPQIEAGIADIAREFGGLDILVNNAGVNTLAHRVPIDQFPTSEWDRIVEVDLKGVYLVSKAASRSMVERDTGRIINIASVVGLVPLRLQCAFAAAKAGVVNLTRAMALELGPRGVLVNAIAPGSILTEGTKQLFYGPEGKFSERAAQLLAHIPLGRPGTVEEIAHAALFLAAPESSYINGHTLTVDGGWTAGYLREF